MLSSYSLLLHLASSQTNLAAFPEHSKTFIIGINNCCDVPSVNHPFRE